MKFLYLTLQIFNTDQPRQVHYTRLISSPTLLPELCCRHFPLLSYLPCIHSTVELKEKQANINYRKLLSYSENHEALLRKLSGHSSRALRLFLFIYFFNTQTFFHRSCVHWLKQTGSNFFTCQVTTSNNT